MRFRKSLILTGLTALVAFGLILSGCSSDDDQPTTNRNTDPTNQMLDMVTAQVHVQLDSVVSHFETGLSMSQVKSSGGLENGDSDLRLVTLPGEDAEVSDGWYVWVVGDLGVSLGDLRVDSMQYRSGDDVLDDALGADGLVYKHAFVSNATDTSADFGNISLDGDLGFTGTDSDTAMVAGTFEVALSSKHIFEDSTLWQNWDIQIAVTDAQVAKDGSSWDTGCPCAGTAEVTVEHSYQKNSFPPILTSWTYNVTFASGSLQVDVVKENLNTSYEDELCAQ
ncbi:MAG: hypothetical protein GY867_06485 [bacterium]|nr:hypothetical protein [bacterium]